MAPADEPPAASAGPAIYSVLAIFIAFVAQSSMLWLQSARGEDLAEQGPALSAFTQSSGKNGSTLRWQTQRAPSAGTAGTASAPGRVIRTAATSALNTADRDTANAMDNPFGDKSNSRTYLSASSLGSLGNDLAEPPEPAPLGAPPSALPTEEPPKEPYVPSSPEEKGFRPGVVTPLPFPSQPNLPKPECPKPEEYFQSIGKLGVDIKYKQSGTLPKECDLGGKAFVPRQFAPTTFTWTASALCHKPLYFEDVQVERYGHDAGPVLQPLASGAHFFLSVPVLPYKMGLTPPFECMYTLGYYRPGSCAPYLLDPLPLSVRAGLAEAGVLTGLIALIP